MNALVMKLIITVDVNNGLRSFNFSINTNFNNLNVYRRQHHRVDILMCRILLCFLGIPIAL